MRACAIIGLVLLILVPLSCGLTCHDLSSYKICFNLSQPHDARGVVLPSTEILVSNNSQINKIILSKGKINIIYRGKEKAWISFQEFYAPNIDNQNDQTVMRDLLTREQSNHDPVFSSWANRWHKGHKAISRKANEPISASIVLFWFNNGGKKTRCIIYSELEARYTEELLGSIRIGARS
jgi:hypothetical protein